MLVCSPSRSLCTVSSRARHSGSYRGGRCTALWRSWLARRPVTAEVVGSSPIRVAKGFALLAQIAQLVERTPEKCKVPGSIPGLGTTAKTPAEEIPRGFRRARVVSLCSSWVNGQNVCLLWACYRPTQPFFVNPCPRLTRFGRFSSPKAAESGQLASPRRPGDGWPVGGSATVGTAGQNAVHHRLRRSFGLPVEQVRCRPNKCAAGPDAAAGFTVTMRLPRAGGATCRRCPELTRFGRFSSPKAAESGQLASRLHCGGTGTTGPRRPQMLFCRSST